ncbi:hypothetical protein HN011_002983, partial [Eciton burchellii]
SSVTGSVALFVNRCQISPKNYIAPWKMLMAEYDNKRALIHTHLHPFVSLPKRKFENATELKKLRNNVSLAAFSNLECYVNYYTLQTLYIISEQFGSKIQTEWNLKRGDIKEYASYQELDAFLSFRIRGLSDSVDEPGSVTDNLR